MLEDFKVWKLRKSQKMTLGILTELSIVRLVLVTHCEALLVHVLHNRVEQRLYVLNIPTNILRDI